MINHLYWSDFQEAFEDNFRILDVVVENYYKRDLDSPVQVALFPARAFLSQRDSKQLIVSYSVVVHYNPVYRRFIYCQEHYPTMYLQEQLPIIPRLWLAMGGLLFLDKESGQLSTPKEGLQDRWFDVWKNEDWFTWSNKDQDYTEKWTRGLTTEEYEASFRN